MRTFVYAAQKLKCHRFLKIFFAEKLQLKASLRRGLNSKNKKLIKEPWRNIIDPKDKKNSDNTVLALNRLFKIKTDFEQPILDRKSGKILLYLHQVNPKDLAAKTNMDDSSIIANLFNMNPQVDFIFQNDIPTNKYKKAMNPRVDLTFKTDVSTTKKPFPLLFELELPLKSNLSCDEISQIFVGSGLMPEKTTETTPSSLKPISPYSYLYSALCHSTTLNYFSISPTECIRRTPYPPSSTPTTCQSSDATSKNPTLFPPIVTTNKHCPIYTTLSTYLLCNTVESKDSNSSERTKKATVTTSMLDATTTCNTNLKSKISHDDIFGNSTNTGCAGSNPTNTNYSSRHSPSIAPYNKTKCSPSNTEESNYSTKNLSTNKCGPVTVKCPCCNTTIKFTCPSRTCPTTSTGNVATKCDDSPLFRTTKCPTKTNITTHETSTKCMDTFEISTKYSHRPHLNKTHTSLKYQAVNRTTMCAVNMKIQVKLNNYENPEINCTANKSYLTPTKYSENGTVTNPSTKRPQLTSTECPSSYTATTEYEVNYPMSTKCL